VDGRGRVETGRRAGLLWLAIPEWSRRDVPPADKTG